MTISEDRLADIERWGNVFAELVSELRTAQERVAYLEANECNENNCPCFDTGEPS